MGIYWQGFMDAERNFEFKLLLILGAYLQVQPSGLTVS
jgi:hypothetical protein